MNMTATTVHLVWISFALLVGCGSKETADPVVTAPTAPAAPDLSQALGDVMAVPDAHIDIEARRWTDVVTGLPDPVEQWIALDTKALWWHSGDGRHLIELTPADRTALVAAAARSTARPPSTGKFEGRYVTVSVRVPTDSPAALEMLRILDDAKARYVTKRLPEARTMTLVLEGHRRGGPKGWQPWRLTVTPDGKLPELGLALSDEEHVGVYDWAVRLPAKRRAPTTERSSDPPPKGIDAFTLTGTLTVAGESRPVVVELGPPPEVEGSYTPLELEIYNVWNMNRGPHE